MNISAAIAALERITENLREQDRVLGEILAYYRTDDEEIPGRDDQGALDFDQTPVCVRPTNPVSQEDGS